MARIERACGTKEASEVLAIKDKEMAVLPTPIPETFIKARKNRPAVPAVPTNPATELSSSVTSLLLTLEQQANKESALSAPELAAMRVLIGNAKALLAIAHFEMPEAQAAADMLVDAL